MGIVSLKCCKYERNEDTVNEAIAQDLNKISNYNL